MKFHMKNSNYNSFTLWGELPQKSERKKRKKKWKKSGRRQFLGLGKGGLELR